jgi:hypothetical protein
MKALKIMMVVLAVGMISVTAFAQDECGSAVAPQTEVDNCNMTGNASDVWGDCWGGDGTLTAWWTFTATDTAHRIRTDVKSTATDSHFVVLEDDCVTPVPGGCSEDEAPPWNGDICVTGLTVDAVYMVELASYTDGACGPYVVSVEPAGLVCGDGVIACDGSEDCDDPDMGACEHGCRDCACLPPPVPMLPAAGLVGLGVLLVTGGALVFGRRRK